MPEEDQEEKYELEEHIDVKKILSDFRKYLDQEAEKDESKGQRLNINSIHMFLSVVTAGGYLGLYWTYHFYKFYKNQEDGKYEYTKKVEIVE